MRESFFQGHLPCHIGLEQGFFKQSAAEEDESFFTQKGCKIVGTESTNDIK